MAIASIRRGSSMADIALWRDTFGATHPVLGDFDEEVWNLYRDGMPQPQYIVFDRDLTVQYKNDRMNALDATMPVALSYL